MLYLIRHAHALDDANDAVRPLSPRGRKQVRATADFLKSSDAFAPTALWYSPLVRARETAALLRKRLARKIPLVETAGLTPEDDPGRIATRLRSERESVAVVGHEPHLSALASLLIARRASPPVFLFKKCTVLALEGAGDYWAVRWQISPELLE